MTYILAENLKKIVAAKTLFDDITFSISKGSKIALVAKNGTGKSTLLRILAGLEQPDYGEISIQNGIKVAYLPQEPVLDLQKTKYEEIFSTNSPVIQAVKNYEQSLQNPEDEVEMQKAYDEMVKLNAWEYEAKVQEIFEKLELTELDGKIDTYSGGQKKRLALAKVLLDEADVLILDEPTNHVDVEMIQWLEEYLSDKNITLILVTHDRYFLDNVCNQILELDNGKVYKHNGNYEYFLENKKNRLDNQNIEIDKTRKHLKKELEWVRRNPQGRQGKATARVDAYYTTKSQLAKKQVEKVVELSSNYTRMGTKVLRLINVSKSFANKKILNTFSYDFIKGEKIGIIGKNGVGKSTFLNLIMGKLESDSGKIIIGDTVKFGYYSQYQTELNNTQRVIESIKEIALNIKLDDGTELSASKMLERFLFSPKEQQTEISKLSGGEKKRISLLRILMTNPNFLILDEPTNDFDLMTLEVLETFLKNFKGCLIIISHDRHFMDSLVDHTFVFKGNGVIKDFPGNYSDYRKSVGNEAPKKEQKTKQPSISNDNDAKKEANILYREIQSLEKTRDKLKTKLFQEDIDYIELGKISKDIENLELEIEKKNEQWLLLSV